MSRPRVAQRARRVQAPQAPRAAALSDEVAITPDLPRLDPAA